MLIVVICAAGVGCVAQKPPATVDGDWGSIARHRPDQYSGTYLSFSPDGTFLEETISHWPPDDFDCERWHHNSGSWTYKPGQLTLIYEARLVELARCSLPELLMAPAPTGPQDGQEARSVASAPTGAIFVNDVAQTAEGISVDGDVLLKVPSRDAWLSWLGVPAR
jgi:hypothetical protein